MAQSKKAKTKKVAAKVKKSTAPKKAAPAKKASKRAPKTLPKLAAKTPTAKPVPAGKPKLKHENLAELFTPLDDRVLIEVEMITQTAGGLFIPASANDRPQRGTVIAVGRGRRDKKGRVRPMDVKKGDEVLFAAFSGTSVELSGRDIIILREADLLGVVE